MTDFARLVAIAMTILKPDCEDWVTVQRSDLALLLSETIILPDWVKFVTTDEDGRVVGHELHPEAIIDLKQWFSEGQSEEFMNVGADVNWSEKIIRWGTIRYSRSDEEESEEEE